MSVVNWGEISWVRGSEEFTPSPFQRRNLMPSKHEGWVQSIAGRILPSASGWPQPWGFDRP
jgi:hypothetical protein